MQYCVLTRNTTSCDRDLVPKPGAAVPDNALKPGRYRLELRCKGFDQKTVEFSVEYDHVTAVRVVLRG